MKIFVDPSLAKIFSLTTTSLRRCCLGKIVFAGWNRRVSLPFILQKALVRMRAMRDAGACVRQERDRGRLGCKIRGEEEVL